MDFNLTESQEMLRTSARDFLKTYYPKSLAREMAKDQKGYTDDLWQKMSDMGWTGMHIPEEFGGAGHFPADRADPEQTDGFAVQGPGQRGIPLLSFLSFKAL